MKGGLVAGRPGVTGGRQAACLLNTSWHRPADNRYRAKPLGREWYQDPIRAEPLRRVTNFDCLDFINQHARFGMLYAVQQCRATAEA